MLYFVTLTYTRPMEDVNAHLATHRAWLDEQIGAGRILVAGPLEDRSGGVFLFECASRDELDTMLVQDSFQVHRLVETRVQGFSAALRCPWWQ